MSMYVCVCMCVCVCVCVPPHTGALLPPEAVSTAAVEAVKNKSLVSREPVCVALFPCLYVTVSRVVW